MRKLRFFAALCCAAAVFAACENNEPKNDSDNSDNSDNTQTNEAATGTVNGHDWVNLGLPSGTKWATCNVGATTPAGYGNYYAWGETTTKSDYSWDSYKYGSGYDELTKYCTDGSYGKGGFTDNLTTLETSDDVATTNWGGKWRMPTSSEWDELIDNCEWVWTDSYQTTDIAGYWVTGKNGNSIFLPAAGYRYDDDLSIAGYYGDYWSSSLNADYPDDAWGAYFYSGNVIRSYSDRYYGQSVRPVLR